MPPVFPEMRRDAIGPGLGGELGRAHRIGVPAATGITNRRDMVDVHTQPEITLHHVKPLRIFPYTQLYHAPVGPRSACSAARQKARRASPRQVSTARPPHRSEEHTSELQPLMRNSYAVSCLKKNKLTNTSLH